MKNHSEEYQYYPAAEEVDVWVEGLFKKAAERNVDVEVLDGDIYEWPYPGNLPYRYGVRHHAGASYVRFSPEGGDDFYCFWQPAFNSPAPLLIHVPGYGGEISAHPELVAQGYSVLHINPLGFCTPDGIRSEKSYNIEDPLGWPQLPDTITSFGKRGYREWFINCIQAVDWVLENGAVQEGRFSFFGTSQGGGASVILGSMYRDRGVRSVAADLPFLTNIPMSSGTEWYSIVENAFKDLPDRKRGWHALGFIDTISHARRLNVPVLLTAGGQDDVCPPPGIEDLYGKLDTIKSITYLKDSSHGYSPEFLFLVRAWFGLYA